MRSLWLSMFAKPTRRSHVLARLFLLAVAVPLCFGQADGTDIHVRLQAIQGTSPSGVRPQDEATELLKANVNLVLVPVTVTDQKDRLVIGLEKGNFGVYDGFERQTYATSLPTTRQFRWG
jgi:hypothetical protein